jgi:hypothetical protein
MRNLLFIGIKKQCSKGFPAKFCEKFAVSAQRRTHKALTTTSVNVNGTMRRVNTVVAWCAKKNSNGICSASVPGEHRVVHSRRVL